MKNCRINHISVSVEWFRNYKPVVGDLLEWEYGSHLKNPPKIKNQTKGRKRGPKKRRLKFLNSKGMTDKEIERLSGLTGLSIEKIKELVKRACK